MDPLNMRKLGRSEDWGQTTKSVQGHLFRFEQRKNLLDENEVAPKRVGCCSSRTYFRAKVLSAPVHTLRAVSQTRRLNRSQHRLAQLPLLRNSKTVYRFCE